MTTEPLPISSPNKAPWLRRAALGLVLLLVLPVEVFLVLSFFFPFPETKLREAVRQRRSTLVRDRRGVLLRPFLSPDDSWLFWVSLDDVPPEVVAAVIAVEDQRFFLHPGVDLIAAVRAAYANVRRGRIVSGASTLTMQLVRLIDPHPRSYAWKATQAFRALQLERLHSKREILELYLNLAPFGGNLVGVETASLSYFQKHASDLTLGEAALLAGLVQSPSRLRPDRHPRRARRRRNHVLRRMLACGSITERRFALALKQRVRVTRSAFPFDAPHFTRMARRRRQGDHVLRLTLDPHAQHVAETAIRERVEALRPAGVTNGAVVIIENGPAALRALVGSCDFFAEKDCGQINGATARRSPGSTLKPFTYAIAFERGIACPATVLADVPRNFSGYRPRNFDQRYRGPVTAREALRDSLNVPAVALLRSVGPGSLCSLLRDCGLTTLPQAPGRHGLSLVLGSVDARLLELTNAYAALARLGVYKPLRILEDEPLPRGRRVLSRGAAWLVADVLSDTTALRSAGLLNPGHTPVRLAWKTGTSHGRRDAWTFAYTPEITVGVWLGNFSGSPSAALVGLEAAAPVACRIVRQLHRNEALSWYPKPEAVGARPVCALSGMPPGRHCPSTVPALYLKGVSRVHSCSVHTLASIDLRTGLCLCPHCAGTRPRVLRVVENWPPELAAWFRGRGSARALMPPHFTGCRSVCHGGPRPRILSPSDGQTFILTGREDATQKLLLQATAATGRLHWFVNGMLYASRSPAERLFWIPQPGRHTIVCSDDAGRSGSVAIEVR